MRTLHTSIAVFFYKVVIFSISLLLMGSYVTVNAQKLHPYERIKDSIGILDNGTIKIGVNLAIGGAITFLADSHTGENIVNNSDWGRQIQLSFYSGPRPYKKNGKGPPDVWKGLGWNPIQSGDYKGHNSKVLKYTNENNSIYIKCRPMQFPLDNEPENCTFEVWITLYKNTAKIRCRLVNNRSDKTQYEGRSQELPAIYTIGSYDNLITYRGTKPFTKDAVSRIDNLNIPGKPIVWAAWEATENWAAALNNKGWGLGVWNPSATHFLGGTYGNKGSKQLGVTDYSTTYIAPTQQEIIDHNIIYEYTYVLILGTLDQIRDYVYTNSRPQKLPSYLFTKDRRHWVYSNTIDAGWPIKQFLKIDLKEKGAMISPSECWNAKDAPVLYLNALYKTTAKKGRVYWKKYGNKDFNEDEYVEYNIPATPDFKEIKIPLGQNPEYNGVITALKIVPSQDKPDEEDWVKIKSIHF